jgi:hypothetical protein
MLILKEVRLNEDGSTSVKFTSTLTPKALRAASRSKRKQEEVARPDLS